MSLTTFLKSYIMIIFDIIMKVHQVKSKMKRLQIITIIKNIKDNKKQ